MPTINFTDQAGTRRSVDVDAGTTARDAALDNDIPGIDGDCGGHCACATCHVFVGDAWIDRVGRLQPDTTEAELLEFADDRTDNSRLACQITVTDDLDGLEITTPIAQH